MTYRSWQAILAAALAAHLGASAEASAQSFPPDEEWVPFRCKGEVMTDGYRDQPQAVDERDIVGDLDAPAGLRAMDDDYLYTRLRLDGDPAPGGATRPRGWGLLFDLDDDLTTYEILILADGRAGTVSVFQNTVTTLPDDPNDPADEPPVAVYAFADAARSVVAADTSYGGNPDYFIDFAVPWSDLEPLGLAPTAPVYVWAASSTSQNSLNADFACHDGSTGKPDLSDIASDPLTLDPDEPDPDPLPDPDPQAPGDSRLEGGGGCSAGGGGTAPALALLLAAAALAAGRSRRGARCPRSTA